MDRFVCVRLIEVNRLDLAKFQFDWDLTFAMMFMNADGAIYGRYGTRSSRKESERELSEKGLAATLRAALSLHQRYAKNKKGFAAAQAKPTKYKTPNDFPLLKGKYQPTINYLRNTSKSCLHCHQIRDAQRAVYREARKPIPDDEIFVYPMPQVVGLTLDPATRATVKKVTPNSAAEEAGFRAGDEIIELDKQSILSIADMQWILHHSDEADEIAAQVLRKNGARAELTMKLKKGWRRATDISWRVSAWPLRRMGTGGLVLKEMSEKERRQANVPADQLALRVDGMGRFGPHATAMRAGFRKGDVLVSFNGRTDAMTHSQFLAMTVQTTKIGQRVPVVVLRSGRRVKLMLPMQR